MYGSTEALRADGGPAPTRDDGEDQTMKETKTYSLLLPRSLKEAVERLSREDGTSINQFVTTAVAEKVSALQTAVYFTNRQRGRISMPSIGS
jgi:hypothetical protein